MNKNIIVVTGATGFVGSALVSVLAGQCCEVRPIARSVAGAGGVAVGDIGPQTQWSAALVGVDCVVHAAARVHMMAESAADPLAEYREVNVEGTLNLGRQAAEAGVRRFVFLSSVKVNGEETCPLGSAEGRGRGTRVWR